MNFLIFSLEQRISLVPCKEKKTAVTHAEFQPYTFYDFTVFIAFHKLYPTIATTTMTAPTKESGVIAS